MSEVLSLEVKAPGRPSGDQVVLRKEKDLQWLAADTKRATAETLTNSISQR